MTKAIKRRIPSTNEESAKKKAKIQEPLRAKQQRDLRKQRRMKENKFFELSEKAKKMWEEMRREDCPQSRKNELIGNLTNLIKGKVREIIRAHDTVRVIQCVVGHGKPEHRSVLFNELREDLIPLCKTKYAKHFVLKMLKYGSNEEKEFIIKSFYGRVKEILKHSHASQVLEYAYNDVANASQRSFLLQEYYGREFALFKDNDNTTLAKILASAAEEKRKKILDEMKEEIIQLINKGSIRHSITHRLIREYFTHADKNSLGELISLVRENLVEIVHTKDGSRVACESIWFGAPKDRKMIVKSFRKFVPKIACEEQGHFILLAVFDSVDDTKLIEKVILSELVAPENVSSLIQDKYAVKVYQYLLSPRDSKFFHKDYVAKLSFGDLNPYSKKDQGIRWTELRSAASPYLLDMVKDHAGKFLDKPSSSLLLVDILANASKGNRAEAMKAVASHFNTKGPYHKSKNEDNLHIIEKPHCSFVLKKLFNLPKSKESFADIFCMNIDSSNLESYIECNRGCFLLLNILEHSKDVETKGKLTSLTSLRKKLKAQDFKGAKILLDKISKED
ncbi:pumilio and CPL domain-containing protein penguin [Brevipalpus obovatus]|uniref:pumilio and CPL domain-containing protein penguin n=1 Tax=Brevipalpus obovatus TaxID=246614 RepID=UPI003D9E0161